MASKRKRIKGMYVFIQEHGCVCVCVLTRLTTKCIPPYGCHIGLITEKYLVHQAFYSAVHVCSYCFYILYFTFYLNSS